MHKDKIIEFFKPSLPWIRLVVWATATIIVFNVSVELISDKSDLSNLFGFLFIVFDGVLLHRFIIVARLLITETKGE